LPWCLSLSFVCISASNVENLEREGASSRTGQIIGELLHQHAPWADFELVKLVDIGLEPCTMCGRCLGNNQCPYDPSFNQLFSKMIEATGVFIVIPHYASIPAKLAIILEKLQEFAFLHSYNELPGPFVLAGKPVGLVVHGGMVENEQVIKHYEKILLEPVANAVKGVGMQIAAADTGNSKGVIFGTKRMIKPAGKCLPEFEHQWNAITQRLSVLVANMLKMVEGAEQTSRKMAREL